MAKNTPKQPEKISADCPHSGFTQLESAYAKSTFCRKCGQHYSIEKLLMKEATSLKAPSFIDKIKKAISGEKIREVACFSCAHKQQVSNAAESSQCPKCGSYIDLRDFKIGGPFGRSIQTQGEVTITSKGDVTSAKIACGTAWIEGKLRGRLHSTGEVHIKVQGKMMGDFDAEKLIVEKRSDVDFARPIRARAVEINGRAQARVYCEGCVSINKGGVLEGAIYAKAVNFEKGSVFSGELNVGPHALEEVREKQRESAEEGGLFDSGGGLQWKPA